MNELQTLVIETLKRMRSPGEQQEINYARMLINDLSPLVDAGVLDGNSWYVRELVLESTGDGGCPVCGKEWKQVRVVNNLVKYVYYKPTCGCFPECPYCGKTLIMEVMDGLGGCTNCYYDVKVSNPYTMACTEWHDTTVQQGRSRQKKRVRCSGYMRPTNGGWRCTECDVFKTFPRLYKTWAEIDRLRDSEKEHISSVTV